ncbi:hypothetical protein J1N35_004887, partial [Gossypium stocksii]
ESSEEVDEDKEMTMFAWGFKRFRKSNKGSKFQKNEGLTLESTEEKDPVICYECKNRDISILIVLNERKMDQAKKISRPKWLLGVMRIPMMKKIKK